MPDNKTVIEVFNAGGDSIFIQANGVTQISVNGAAMDSDWSPGTYPNGPQTKLTFSGNSHNGDGMLGEGENTITVIPQHSGGTPKQATVTLPGQGAIGFGEKLQMYVFWNASDRVSWIFLKRGQPIAGAMNID